MEIDYDKLTKEKENINQKLILLKENLKNENLKKEYGTIDQKNEWDQLYKNLEIDIKKMSKELMNISKDEYDNQTIKMDEEKLMLLSLNKYKFLVEQGNWSANKWMKSS